MKAKFKFFMEMFTKLTTIIFICSSVYILIFFGFNCDVSFSYIWGVLLLSLILSLARLPLYTDKIISRKAQIIYNILYLIFADAVVLGIGLLLGWFSVKHPATIIGMEITFVAVSAAVWTAFWISNKNSEEKLNEQLEKLKKE